MKIKITVPKILFPIIVLFNILILSDTFAQTPNWIWAKGYGTTYDDVANDISFNASGNFYVAGSYKKRGILFGAFSLPNEGNSDAFLIKFNSKDSIIWAIGAGGVYDDAAYSLASDNSENVFLAGKFASSEIVFGSDTLTNSIGAGSFDAFLAKFDSSGKELWAKKADAVGRTEASSVTTDVFGNVYLSGNFYDWISFGLDTLTSKGSSDVYLFKFNSKGDEIWAKSINGAHEVEVTSIVSDDSGNLYMTGNFRTSEITIDSVTLPNSGDYDMFVAKFDSNGSLVWAKKAGGIYTDIASSVTLDGSGNLYFAGNYRSPDITIGATPFTTNSTEFFYLFLAKFDTDGNPIWTKDAEATERGENDASSLVTDAAGNIYVSGYFVSKSLVFGTDTLTSINNTGTPSDIFLLKYDPNGDLLWTTSVGGKKDDRSTSIKLDNSENIYLVGSFGDKRISLGTNWVSNANRGGYASDILIAKANEGITGIAEGNQAPIPTKLILSQNYPNPFNPTTTIKYSIPSIKTGHFQSVQLKVYDVLGRKVATLINEMQASGNYEVKFNAESLPSGVYYLKMTAGNFISVKKMMLLK